MLWHSTHVRAVCSSDDEHTLHFGGARCRTPLRTSSTPSVGVFSSFSIRHRASVPVKTPPRAIYDRLIARMFFGRWLSAHSFSFWCAIRVALCIAIWLRAYSVGDGGLCVWRLINRLISSVWWPSLILLYGVSVVHFGCVYSSSCGEGV